MPLFGVVYYFSISPRYFPEEIIQAKFVALFILTIILPLLLYLILKLIGIVNTVNLETTKERIYPLLLNSVVVIIVLKKILTPSQSPELYFFFVGILISNIACLLLAVMKFKASIHMIAITGVFMFFIALSIHFSINLNDTLIFMAVSTGAVATSRLHLKAHSYIELIIGSFIGLIPQLILVTYWL
ncbi:hypothetical protein FPF71_02445 [Algibacter amylolyticus]|uniref:Transmembrane protein n=2 Tax=Algibacter amylolyticus TaxID=1608400 RepID=A0A5M7BFY7_9FLAO|nr:hypothetical protein F2B50_02445 [Algibacter amylolyticus]TSJ82464.1 hypothetical protein FPF71_02445 [Algibacter amylolyticus]